MDTLKFLFIGIIATAILAFFGLVVVGGFVPIAIGDYSQGERTGLVNKVAYKGLICKTYEGYIYVGNGNNVDPEQFNFTVKDPAVAAKINEAQGKIATLSYEEKLISSSCWGDTSYNVTDITVK